MGSSKQRLNKELILEENNQTKKKEDSDNEKAKKKEKVARIIVRAESESDSNNEITIELQALLEPMKTCCWKIGDHPYLVIERALSKPDEWLDESGNLIPEKIEENADTCTMNIDLIPVVKLDHISNESNPHFKEFKKKM